MTTGQGSSPGLALSLLFRLIRVGTQLTRVEPLVLQLLEQVCLTLGADIAVIHLVHNERLVLHGRWDCLDQDGQDQLRVLEDLPINEHSLVGYTAMHRQTTIRSVEDWPSLTRSSARAVNARSGLGVPLLARERLIGTMSVVRRSERRFQPEDTELFEVCASYIALAIEHAKLFEAQERKVDDLQLLLQISRAFTSSRDREELLRTASENLARLVDATHTFVWLLNPSEPVLSNVLIMSKDRADFGDLRLPLNEPSLAARVMATRAPLREEDADLSPLVNPKLKARYGLKSLLGVPLLVKGAAVGAVIVGDERRRRPWTDYEVEQATLVATQLAMSLENARLFQDLKASYDALAKAQAQLVERERLAALGELAAVVAHEVRNPLGVIFNSMSSLRRMLKPMGDADALFAIVNEEAERLNTMVGDLLDFSRPKDADRQRTALGSVVQSALVATQTARDAAQVETQVDLSRVTGDLYLDARLLQQALTNLLLNATQAMPKGGRLTVTAELEGTPERRVLRMDVTDTGPGLAPELQERVFQPFFTTKAAGSGLGLAVVKRIADAHKGEVTVRARVGDGATFTLRIPVDAPA